MPATLRYHDFSGGLNLRDASGELAENESPDMMNITLDERGGITKRLGYAKDGSMSAFAANIVNLFYSSVLGQLVVQEGVNVRKRTAAGTFSLVKAFSTAARVTFVERTTRICTPSAAATRASPPRSGVYVTSRPSDWKSWT